MSTTVLAIDDSVTMRKVLEITFGGDEFNAVLANSSEQAMQLLSSTRPAIAVIDHTLGDANGYDLCRQIKSASPQTKVIILSSKQFPFDRARGTASGADDFMDKPFDTEKMLEKMRFVATQASKPVAAAAAAPKPAPAPAPAATIASAVPRARTQTLSYGTPAPAPATPAPPQVSPGPQARGHTVPGAAAVTPQAATPRPGSVVAKPSAARAQATAAPIAAAVAGNGQLAGKLEALGLTPDQVHGVLALSREVVEQVVWEVVPVLAETLIKEEIRRLTSD